MGKSACKVCAWERTTGKSVDTSKGKVAWAGEVGVSEASVRRHLKHPKKKHEERTEESSTDGKRATEFIRSRPVTLDDARDWVRASGDDPEDYELSVRSIAYGDGLSSNRMTAIPKRAGSGTGPEWQIIQQAHPVIVNFETIPPKPARNGLKLSLKGGDTQIGFRALPDGTYEEFHDLQAMNVFTKVAHDIQPDSIVILGDFLDLPSQSRWAQEPGFARTTQMSLDIGHEFLAALRAAAPESEIVLVEGNHDKRLETYAINNALASYGLRQANKPDDLPVMSLVHLLRLKELNITYMDAYPTAVHWDHDTTRNMHGTRANSKGSTTAQYMQELPHISSWVGHTHRAEITYKTVMGPRGDAIESYTANPGALCKTDGTVPSVHGAIHADGTSAKVVEDWQQAFGVNLYDPETGQDWPQVYRIRDGVALYNGKRYTA